MRTYPFKSGIPHGIELTPLEDTVARARAMVTEPHRADFHQVVWVRRGKASMLLDLVTIPMQAGSLMFIRKDRVLMYDRSGNCRGWVLRFTEGFFVRTQDDARFLRECRLFRVANEAPVISVPADDAALLEVAGMIEREIAGRDDGFQHAVLQNLVHNFLIQAERRLEAMPEAGRTGDAARALGQKYQDLVDADLRREKKVAGYARRLGITEKRLQAATMQAFGKSPKAILDERVAMEAKRMLLFGEATVKEICFDLGFDEVTNFIKWFRKHAQATPAGFRSRYRP